ncbi:hypothetical protein E1627_09555 [Salmonella enterica subsp. enterica serovar Tyresoe]|nr:hypothetical protein [Salmonella enterica subsp. enterica serovar Tyresoe]
MDEEGSYAPLAQVLGRGEKTRIRWFRNGLNGSPEALADSDGGVKWRQQWPARLWGRERHEVLKDAHGVMQNLRFQGQYLDRETGLHYNLFRYYDPECGRFTQPDPANLEGGINLYAYAPNPLGWIDPWGLACQKRDKNGKFRSEIDPHGKSGRDFEQEVFDRLSKDKNIEVLGRGVHIKTKYGSRYVDILYRDKRTGKIYAGEVKSNTARRDNSQKMKDKEIGKGQGTYGSGKTVPVDMKGQKTDDVIPIEIRVE